MVPNVSGLEVGQIDGGDSRTAVAGFAAGVLLMVFFVVLQIALGATLDAALTNAIR